LHQPDAPDFESPVHSRKLAVGPVDEAAHGPEGHGQDAVPTGHDPRTGRRLSIFAGALIIILLAAFFVVRHTREQDQASLAAATAARAEQPPPVEVVDVQLAPPTQSLTLPGETSGWYTSTIYARVNGYLGKWFVDIGDHVHKDQVLATIETPDLDAQLAAAQAQLVASQAEEKVKEADAEFAKTTYQRWQGSPRGVVSEQETEDKKARYQGGIAQLNAAKARVELDQANVDRLTFLTKFKQVTAPYEGVITERRVDIGDLVTAGSTANTTSLFRIVQSDQIRVFADVPQSASVHLDVGTEAEITAAAHPGQVFKGNVTRTSRSIDVRARTLRVEVDLPNKDFVLIPGMYVTVTFHLKPTTFVQIPASALLFRASGPQVALVDKSDIVKFQDVSIARDNGNLIEIGSGLSEGDRVAVNISNQIADGQKVTVAESGKGVPTASK
jgi:RND family efflux transporter MFP subunit